jgi:predicted tellurium resistance membrane protein TerC
MSNAQPAKANPQPTAKAKRAKRRATLVLGLFLVVLIRACIVAAKGHTIGFYGWTANFEILVEGVLALFLLVRGIKMLIQAERDTIMRDIRRKLDEAIEQVNEQA